MITTEIAFGDATRPLTAYMRHLFVWVLIVSPLTAIVGINFNAFRSTWVGLTLMVGTFGTTVLVGELTPVTAWLLCVTFYGGYYYFFLFKVPRLKTYSVLTLATLMALCSIAIVILSVVASVFLSMMIYGGGGPEAI